jgi:tetratricopeptide (TPR) repeat protein
VGSPEAEARALGGLADAAYAQGRMRTAFGHFHRCCELSREHGLGRIEVANRSMVGFSRMYLNEPCEALEDGLEAVQATARVGHQRAEMLAETLCVQVHLETGALDRAEEHLGRMFGLARRLGARRFEAQGFEFEGRMLLARGLRADAARALRRSLTMSREVGAQFIGPRTASALALAVADPAERRSWLAEGEALLARGAVGHNHLWFWRDAAEATLEEGDWDAALRHAAALEDFARAEPLPFTELFAARARALAAAGRGERGPALRAELVRVRDALEAYGMRPCAAAVATALEPAGWPASRRAGVTAAAGDEGSTPSGQRHAPASEGGPWT